jgi:hypothetical protein
MLWQHHVEWLNFMRQIDRETPPDKTFHLIKEVTSLVPRLWREVQAFVT